MNSIIVFLSMGSLHFAPFCFRPSCILSAAIMLHTFVVLFSLSAAKICPMCGNTTVPYPLSTSNDCGDPQYRVICTTSKQLVFPAMSGSYPIQKLNPGSQTLVIEPSPISTSTCETSDLHNGGLLLNQSRPFNVTSGNSVMLLNCSSRLLLSPLNCSSNNLCSQFLQQNIEGQACRNKMCCTFTAGGSSTKYKITIDEADCTAYTSFVSLNPSQNASKWTYGVELEWTTPSELPCHTQKDCGNNSTCRTDAKSQGLKCLCNAGYQWNLSSGLCVKDVHCFNGISGLACESHHRRKAAIIGGVTAGFAASLVAAFVMFFICKKTKLAKEAKDKLAQERQLILSENSGGKSAKLFTSTEMRRATHRFAKERLLGSGAFGEVYRGTLDDGTIVAVKCAKLGNIKGTEQVLNEVRILSQVNHRNLARLLGCCVETEQPLLVYEYISNGTLLEHVNGSKGTFLDWKTRLNIAMQTAEGLAYLHSAAYPPIFHRDVKSSNILLDANLNARVSDFGLSRLAEPDLSHISTCAQGTLGYLDPEYYRNYQLTDKSDVYSFGVVLLELVTSQKAIDFGRGQDDVNLAIYVLSKSEAGQVMDVPDPRLTASAPTCTLDTIRAFTFLGLSCLQENRCDRPTMKEVAEELQYLLNRLSTSRDSDKNECQ